MRSVVSIDVAAPAELVFDLAHDVERWPTILPHYRSVRVEGHTDGTAVVARYVAIRPIVGSIGVGVPVAWRAITWNEPEDHRLRFRHVGGPTGGMDVTWRIEPSDAGCRISIEHDFDPRIGAWAAIVDRLFVRPIAGRTLGTFKALAETMARLT